MTYSVNYADDDQRDMSLEQIVKAYQSGEITDETFVWKEGMEDWIPLVKEKAILEAINRAGSKNNAASAKRTRGKGSIDLFGTPEDESTSSQSQHDVAFTGQRNEQSALFSLQSLAAQHSESVDRSSNAPAKRHYEDSSSGSTTEDSGLIDLGALAKEAQRQNTPQAMVVPAIQLQGILAAPVVPEEPVQTAAKAPPQKSNTAILIGASLIAAAILGTGAMIVFKTSDNTPGSLTPPPAVPTDTPTTSATPVPSIEPSTTSSAATAQPIASASTKPTNTPSTKTPNPGSTSTAKKDPIPTTTTTATATSTNAGPCDLKCQMDRATKKKN